MNMNDPWKKFCILFLNISYTVTNEAQISASTSNANTETEVTILWMSSFRKSSFSELRDVLKLTYFSTKIDSRFKS